MKRALVLLGMLLLCSTDAQAFVCMRVSSTPGLDLGCPPPQPDPYGASLSWPERTVPYSLFEAGTNRLPGDEEHDLLRAAFLPWSTAQECAAPNRATDLTLAESELSTRERLGYDFLEPETNENLLIFRDEQWPRGESSTIIALTTNTYNALTGEILDADIEFNSARFDFRDLPNCCGVECNAGACGGSSPPDCCAQMCSSPAECNGTDLLNTAVHEIGHFLGIGHTSVEDATMVGRAQSSEIAKRDLACDDRNAIVFKYPDGEPNGYCDGELDSECGCCAPPGELTKTARVSVVDEDPGTGCRATGDPATAGWLFALSLLPLISRRRRRHGSTARRRGIQSTDWCAPRVRAPCRRR